MRGARRGEKREREECCSHGAVSDGHAPTLRRIHACAIHPPAALQRRKEWIAKIVAFTLGTMVLAVFDCMYMPTLSVDALNCTEFPWPINACAPLRLHENAPKFVDAADP